MGGSGWEEGEQEQQQGTSVGTVSDAPPCPSSSHAPSLLQAPHTLPHAACCGQEKPPAGVLSVQAVEEAHWPQEALQKPPS